jgi:hypothetical protein
MITAVWISVGLVIVTLLMKEVRERKAINAVLRPDKAIQASSKFDIDDPVFRAALREVDEVAPNMPVAPPRDERDMTEAEKAEAREAEIKKARRAVAEKLASMWAATAITSAAGEYLLPNGSRVTYAQVAKRGWVAIVEEQLDNNPTSWRVGQLRP